MSISDIDRINNYDKNIANILCKHYQII